MIKNHKLPPLERPKNDNFDDEDDCNETCVIFAFAFFGVIGVAVGALATYFLMR